MAAWHTTALAELTTIALAGSDASLVLAQSIRRVAAALAVAHCAVWQCRPNGSGLELVAGIGWPDAALLQTPVVASSAPLNRGLHQSSPMLVEDWPRAAQLHLPSLATDLMLLKGYCALIQAQNEPFGLLEVDTSAARRLSAEEMSFLQAAASILAVAFQRTAPRQSGDLAAEQSTPRAAAPPQAVHGERQRLARELHDSVTQPLYSVTLHAEAAMRLLAAGDVSAACENLRVLQATAQEALDEMRLLIFELRPPVLEQVGLAAALQARLHAVEGRAKLQTRLLVDGVRDLPLDVEEALYRIAQEALNNALKHAHARHITIRMAQIDKRVSLEVSDDGDGFDLAAAAAGGGFGLRGIAERVAQLGGLLAIHSEPGAGTRLRVEIDS